MSGPKTDLEAPAARFERACGRFFIRVILILAPIILVDFASRYFWSHRRSKIERRFPVEVVRHPKPYVMFGGIGGGALPDGERLNELGYRGKAPSAEKAAGEYRIFMLGGSTVFSGEPPIAVLLERFLREDGREGVSVYNFGVVSSVSGMELARILYEVVDLSPDMVVVYNGSNDIMLPLTHDPRPGNPFNFIVYENNPLLESDIRSYPALSLLLYGSNLARYFVSSYFMERFIPLDEVRAEVGWGSDSWREAIADAYVGRMVKAKKLCEGFGVRFIGFMQPLVYFKDRPAPEEQTEHFRPQRKAHAVAVRRLIRDKIALLPAEDRVAVIDLTDVFDETAEQVFTDHTHTNQEGKEIVASAMCRHIIGQFELE